MLRFYGQQGREQPQTARPACAPRGAPCPATPHEATPAPQTPQTISSPLLTPQAQALQTDSSVVAFQSLCNKTAAHIRGLGKVCHHDCSS